MHSVPRDVTLPSLDSDDDNEVTPAAVGESAEVEGEGHDGAFDFGGAGPVRPPPVAETLGQSHVDMVMPKLTRKRLMRMMQMPELKS